MGIINISHAIICYICNCMILVLIFFSTCFKTWRTWIGFCGKTFCQICQELSFMTMELFTSFCVGCGYRHWDKGHQYRMVTIIYMMSFILFNIKMNLQLFIFSAPVVEEGWRICKCKLFFHSQPPAPNFSTF